MALDVSRLNAVDAAVALKSFPRRYREALSSFKGDDNIEAMARRIGPDGDSAIDALTDTVRTIELLSQALQQVLVHDQPVLHTGVVDAAERVWPSHGGSDEPLDALLRELDDVATKLGDTVEHTDAGEWKRTATIAGSDRAVTALDVVREAVRAGADNLRRVDASMAAARR
jgi:hypothetical protein